MRRTAAWTKQLLAMTAVAAVLGSALVAPKGAGANAATKDAIVWTKCHRTFECARITVPLDYTHPSGKEIRLAVIKLASTSKGKVPNLFMNPGGPGESGISFLTDSASGYSPLLRRHFNLVSWDPRGIGASAPIHCVSPNALRALIAENPAPRTPKQIRHVVSVTRTFVANCKAKNAVALLSHVSTQETARDLDVLRQRLGDKQLTYMGFSYGTFLGALYAQTFPSHIRILILDGAVDPAESVLSSDVTQSRGFEVDLADFFVWCDHRSSCRKALPAPAKASFNRLFTSLKRGHHLTAQLIPSLGGTQPVTYGTALSGVIASLYSISSWPQLGSAIAAGLHGDGSTLAAFALFLNGFNVDGTVSNIVDSNIAISCLDRPTPTAISTYVAWSRILGKAAPTFGEAEAWGGLDCKYWPARATGRVGRLSIATKVNVVVVGTTHDPATPYANAISLASQLPGSALLTRKGDGHTAYFSSKCIARIIDASLITAVLPPKRTVCTS